MIDTSENIKETISKIDKFIEEYAETEEIANSEKYDYLDD